MACLTSPTSQWSSSTYMMICKATSRGVGTPRTPTIHLLPTSHKRQGEEVVSHPSPQPTPQASKVAAAPVICRARRGQSRPRPTPVCRGPAPARATHGATGVSETRNVARDNGDPTRNVPTHPPCLADGVSTVSLLAGRAVEANGGGIA